MLIKNLTHKLIFTAESPTPGEIFCAPPTEVFVNNTPSWIEVAHKKTFNREETEESFDFCNVYDDASEKYLNPDAQRNREADLVECSEFEHLPQFLSIVHQYELICSRKWLVALTQSFHLLGVLVGGIITHFLLKM